MSERERVAGHGLPRPLAGAGAATLVRRGSPWSGRVTLLSAFRPPRW
jgi:hypothetical protein